MDDLLAGGSSINEVDEQFLGGGGALLSPMRTLCFLGRVIVCNPYFFKFVYKLNEYQCWTFTNFVSLWFRGLSANTSSLCNNLQLHSSWLIPPPKTGNEKRNERARIPLEYRLLYEFAIWTLFTNKILIGLSHMLRSFRFLRNRRTDVLPLRCSPRDWDFEIPTLTG